MNNEQPAYIFEANNYLLLGRMFPLDPPHTGEKSFVPTRDFLPITPQYEER